MSIHKHTNFILGKVQKRPREIEGKTEKFMRREIFAGGEMVGAIEIPGGQKTAPGYLRDKEDTVILRWERPKLSAVEFFFYSEDNEPKGSLKLTSSRISKKKELEYRDPSNTLFLQFEGIMGKMTKEKTAGTFKDLQGQSVGRTWRGYKDAASGMKGPMVEAHGYQDFILASILPLARETGWNPNKY